ncbi:MAG: SDR family NAD(P)-dependent oxidoreductase, partial [Gemmataceae bacterium]
ALFALEYALAELWQTWGLTPDYVLGHGVGEYVAACLAGVFSLEDGLRLVAERGRLLGTLSSRGAMAVVHADAARTRAAVEAHADSVALAALNGPTNTVISGSVEAVAAVRAALEGQGISSAVFTDTPGFHAPLVAPVLDQFERLAQTFTYHVPRLGWISNLTGRLFDPDETPDANYWREHSWQPIRFGDGVRTLAELGCGLYLEVGPQRDLTRLAQLCFAGAAHVWLHSLERGAEDWAVLLGSLAQMYTAGVPVNWDGFNRDYSHRKVTLPTYPFERQRYWVTETPSRQTGPGSSAHRLLGSLRRSAAHLDCTFETNLSVSDPPWLTEHRVFGAVVFPGAGFLEAALAAARETLASDRVVLEQAEFRHALVFPEEGVCTLQTVIKPNGDGTAEWQVYSRSGPVERNGTAWTLHATGRARTEDSTLLERANETLTSRLTRCPEASPVESLYAGFAELGLEYGPSFRGVQELRRGQGEAVARIKLPEDTPTESHTYLLHPALLDACLQVCAGAAPATDDDAVHLPFAIERLWVAGRPSGPLACWSKLRPDSTAQSPTFDLELWEEESGRIVAAVVGLSLRRAEPAALKRSGQPNLADWLYEVDWEPSSTPAARLSADFLPGPKQLASLLAARTDELLREVAETYRHVLPELEGIATEYVLAALGKLGVGEPGQRLSNALLAERVAARQRRLTRRLFEMLDGNEFLRRVGDEWEVLRPLTLVAPVERLARLRQEHPQVQIEATLLQRCGEQLAEVLRGTCAPLPLLFPPGSKESAERLYRDAPAARAFNSVVAEVIAAASAALPAGRPFRILEIGAGTGGTTASVLPHLKPERTEYLFSDVSAGFLAPAREQFGAYPFVDYRVLDIERDPLSQGFDAHNFDLVLAANVLHATADLRQVLRHVRQLLAPSGLLLLLEGTVPQRWVDITFGLLEGWWKFADADLRPEQPLLSARAWQDLLAVEAFTEVACLPPGEAAQALVIARGPLEVDAERTLPAAGRRLLFAYTGAMTTTLVERLAVSGPCVQVEVGPGFESIDDEHFRLAPFQSAEFEELLTTVDGGSLDEVIYLWGLNSQVDDVSASCVGLLYLVQALVRMGSPQPPRLVVLTQEALSVATGDCVEGFAGAALWGLARVIAREHPELRCCCIDLDANEEAACSSDYLLAELSAPDGEDQIAYRAGQRHVARLIRTDAGALTLAGQPRHWVMRERGSPDNLKLETLARSRPGPGEVEIAVQASGLNFLDVMDVLGILPFERPGLGAECVGRITAVGEGVAGLALGDEVVALASGAFSTHVLTPAALAVHRPPYFNSVAAATVPVAFLTAVYALQRLGGLKAHQKVLIHAAAGGVGLAAVQVAQRAGAEIYATASPAKHAYLRAQGVEHVFHSRTLAFAEEIQQLTDGRGVDLVLNSLSSGEFIPKSLSVLCRGGHFLEMGKRGIWTAEQVRALRPDVSYSVVALERLGIENPAALGAMLRELMEQFAAGQFRPLPATVYPLANAAAALQCMQQARHIGKIVLQVPPALEGLLRADATYLITGGLGGLGLLTARWLVTRGARHLVLLGRNAPSDTARQAIAEMEQSGATVVVVQADVSVIDEVEAALEQVAHSLPPLRGIIHAAGTLDDGVLLNQTRERFETVLAAKVAGSWHLHRLTEGLALDFFVLYSSAAGLLGPSGQGNHAAANAFLDALAQHRQAQGLPGISIDWGAWSEVGAAVRRGVVEQASEGGLGVIDPDSGLAALERVLELGHAQVCVMPADWTRLRRQSSPSSLLRRLTSESRAARKHREESQDSSWSTRLRAAAPGERAELLVDFVQGQVARVLGLQPGQLPDRGTGFFELGMDSLMAVELRNRLQADLGGRALSSTVVFDHPTVDDLAHHLSLLNGELASSTRWDPPVPTAEPIAIVGLSCRFPGGEGPDAYWQLLAEGREAVREVPADRWDVDAYYDPDPDLPGKMYVRRGGLLEQIDRFDPAFFSIAPREALSLDPQQRLLLETAWEALEHAGLSAGNLATGRTGVFVGICGSEYAGLLQRRGEAVIDAYLGTGTSPAAAAGRLSYVLGLQGPCVAIDTACSSSLVAVSQACDSLRAGRCDAALVGGVNAMVVPEPMIAACKARMLSPAARCKTFDAAADGFARGEGCGVVVLKRLSAARRDGDRVLALIRGSAVNQDGRSGGLTVPNGPAQQAVVREALSIAGIAPHEVEYVEAHGTGTSLGDPIEVQALAAALGEGREEGRPLLI